MTYDLGDNPVQYMDRKGRLDEFVYDALSRRTSLTLPNGVTATYAYDPADALTAITYAKGAAAVGDLGYAYDQVGRRIRVTGTLARTGLPDALASASYDAANRLTNWGGAALTYDAAGNLLTDGAHTYAWDARGRLSVLDNAIIGADGANFAYDALGRRERYVRTGVETDYVYDGLNVVQEQRVTRPIIGNPTRTVLADLLTGLGIDETYTRTDSAGARSFLTDALGSTLALTDAAGAQTTSYTYEPYGAVTATGATSTNPFHYTGRENDGTGPYYYRARYYSLRFHRFISEDPLGIGGGVNAYTYVEGSPVVFTDATGECPWCIAAGIGALTGSGIDLALQLLQNGGDPDCVDWASVGAAALSGAALSGLGPTGFVLGRGGHRAAPYGYNKAPGILNRGATRIGWSGHRGSDVLSLRVGRTHYDIPGTGVPSGANPVRDGVVSGMLGGEANRAARGGSCGCKE